MLACARLGAIHSVVFGGFASDELATRIDDAEPKVIVSASCGIEPDGVVAYKPLLDAAIDLAAQAGALHRPPAAAARGASSSRAAIRLGEAVARRRAGGVRLGRGDRPALHPLHLRHDRAAEGDRARQRRPRGRARVVDAERLRRRAGRGVLGGLGRRLGRRALVHRLRAAPPRLHDGALRGQAGRHAGRGRVLAGDRGARRRDAVHRADGVPRDPAAGSGRASTSGGYDLSRLPHAVPRRRALRPGDAALGRAAARRAGDRPLVADRDRLADRRELPRHRAAAGRSRARRPGRCPGWDVRVLDGERREPGAARSARSS